MCVPSTRLVVCFANAVGARVLSASCAVRALSTSRARFFSQGRARLCMLLARCVHASSHAIAVWAVENASHHWRGGNLVACLFPSPSRLTLCFPDYCSSLTISLPLLRQCAHFTLVHASAPLHANL
eukprot:5863593-Pleurochrysis_carterae.AAC.2